MRFFNKKIYNLTSITFATYMNGFISTPPYVKMEIYKCFVKAKLVLSHIPDKSAHKNLLAVRLTKMPIAPLTLLLSTYSEIV